MSDIYGSDEWWKAVGERIKVSRIQRGLSLMELSLLCNFWDLQILESFEKGNKTSLNPDGINELCKKLKCDPKWLLFGPS